jgi:hypothetical protein
VSFSGKDRQIFAEIEVRAQFLYRHVSRTNFVEICSEPKPVGKSFLTDLGPRRVEQLKQRRRAEQVDVSRERMTVQKTGAVGPRAGPLRIESRHATFVQSPGATGTLNPEQHSCVNNGENGKRGSEDDRPCDSHPVADKRLPRQNRRGCGYDKTGIRDVQGGTIASRDLLIPTPEAGDIFRTRIGGHVETNREEIVGAVCIPAFATLLRGSP